MAGRPRTVPRWASGRPRTCPRRYGVTPSNGSRPPPRSSARSGASPARCRAGPLVRTQRAADGRAGHRDRAGDEDRSRDDRRLGPGAPARPGRSGQVRRNGQRGQLADPDAGGGRGGRGRRPAADEDLAPAGGLSRVRNALGEDANGSRRLARKRGRRRRRQKSRPNDRRTRKSPPPSSRCSNGAGRPGGATWCSTTGS